MGMAPEGCMSVAETAASNPDLSVLVEALTAAGLADTLADPSLVATIFAPTDTAFETGFEEALTELGMTKDEFLADTEALTNVLTFHVVPDVAAMSSDLTDGQMLPTMEGDDLTVDLSMPDKVAINPDIEACMAVIHVIDKVLVPPAAPMP